MIQVKIRFFRESKNDKKDSQNTLRTLNKFMKKNIKIKILFLKQKLKQFDCCFVKI